MRGRFEEEKLRKSVLRQVPLLSRLALLQVKPSNQQFLKPQIFFCLGRPEKLKGPFFLGTDEF